MFKYNQVQYKYEATYLLRLDNTLSVLISLIPLEMLHNIVFCTDFFFSGDCFKSSMLSSVCYIISSICYSDNMKLTVVQT